MSKNSYFKPVDPKQNFVELEKEILNQWEKEGILKKNLAQNSKSQKRFSFLDGPITANNAMGVHHAWGRTLKDLWQRFYNMQGYRQRFQNGFDEQGLWIEVEVEKELGFKNKKDIEKFGIDKFVEKCKERVKKFSSIQTEQSKRLGYFMDWDNSYHTSSDENNYAIWNFLKVCNQKGYLYKGRDSVPWCPRCGTAISQHEILTEEYKEITHEAVYVKYKISGQLSVVSGEVYLLVWTTTPWTLPSNVAIAINPDYEYGIWEIEGNKLIVEKMRAKALGLIGKPQKVFGGKQLIGKSYQGNFDDLPALYGVEHRVIAAKDLVTQNEGTGLVHIAPGAGEEDFKLARDENLQVVESIDEEANYIDGFGDLTGQNAKNNPDLVIGNLQEKGVLFKIENYKHRYPTCWRCKTELVWRVVNEWYIAMDRKEASGMTLRQQMVSVAKQINWIPEFGLNRELDWLKNMHDWLISKKRYWGLALPIWECAKCGYFEVFESAQDLKKQAVYGWQKFEGHSPHRPWIDEVKIKCQKCTETVSRIPDVGNVWLDAGIVPFSTLPTNWFPADFITESFPGQFKNWFYSLIAASTVLKNTAPFINLLGHGLVRDEKGEEMHKSKGNSIEFNEAADKIGVDVMRWLYLRTKPEHNVNFGYHRADEIRRQFILPLWNVYSFFVTYAHINNWQPPQKEQRSANVLDMWILSRLNGSIKNITSALDGMNTKKFDAWDAIGNAEIFIGDLSNWYVRRIRERVSLTSANRKDVDQALTTLWKVLVVFAKVLAPIAPFLSESIYRNLTQDRSVHLTDWPEFNKKLYDQKLEIQMHQARLISEKAHAKRKEAGIKVRQPLLKLSVNNPNDLPKEIKKIIADEVNVKKVEIKKGKILTLSLDTKITPELKVEGQAREIIRNIQSARKEAGCDLSERITVNLPTWPKEFEESIKKETLAKSLIKSSKFTIVRD